MNTPSADTATERPAEDDFAGISEFAQWRAGGAAARDPVRYAIVEALVRRAAAQEGEVRAWMAARVRAWIAADATATPSAPAASAQPSGTEARTGALAPLAPLIGLAALVDRLGRGEASIEAVRDASPARASSPAAALPRTTLPAPVPTPLKAVARHRGTWSRLRAEQRLRQSLAQVPAMAGPLNSSQVVHRALVALRAVSPAYLDALMQHADTLAWLEQASGGALPASAAPGATPPAEARRIASARAPRRR